MPRLKTRRTAQSGFTLVEILVVSLLIGLLSWTFAPSMKSIIGLKELSNRSQQLAINQKIAAAMLSWSEETSSLNPNTSAPNRGALPEPCLMSSPKLYYGVPGSATCLEKTVVPYLQQQGIPASQMLTDGTANANVRVFQKLTSSTMLVQPGLLYPAGPTVDLNYDFGVVYSTTCGQTSCGTASTKVVPTANILKEDSANLGNPDPAWAPQATDYGVVYLSTLPLQKKLLQSTSKNITNIIAALKSYYATKGVYPTDGCPSVLTSSSPSHCSTTQLGASYECWDGWYSLSDANSDLLLRIGIGSPNMGNTAWNGSLEFCRDYDAGNVKGAKGLAPIYGAIRINRLVQSGLGPDTNNLTQNVVISF